MPTKFTLFFCMLWLVAPSAVAGYCSLLVKVSDPAGSEVEARVAVEEHDGRRIEKENQLGGVQFCNLGITPVTVVVGRPACNQVIVRNVPLVWGETTNLPVTYDDHLCRIDNPPVAACQFLLRFVTAIHKPISGVSLEIQTPEAEGDKADEFGRLLVRIAARKQLEATASAQGYLPSKVEIPCTSENLRLERYVVLEKDRK